jgi:hypothetical protein
MGACCASGSDMRLFGRKSKPVFDQEKARLLRNLDEAWVRHLEVLRREIANLIVAADPGLMVRCYEKAWTFEREIADNPARAQAEEVALVAKFPMFSEFELLGTRHFARTVKREIFFPTTLWWSVITILAACWFSCVAAMNSLQNMPFTMLSVAFMRIGLD